MKLVVKEVEIIQNTIINQNRVNKSFIKYILFLLTLSIYIFNAKQDGRNYISLLLLGLLLIYFILSILKTGLIKNSKVFTWYLTFSFLSVMSFTFSISPQNSFEKISSFSFNLIIILVLTNYIDSKERLESILKILVVCGFINALMLLLGTNYSQVTTYSRAGNQIGNVNLIAMQMTYSLISLFIIYKNQRHKVIYLIMGFFMTTAILFTGSRKGIISIILFLAFVMLFRNINNVVKSTRNIIVGIVIIILLLIIVMNNDFLYTVLGTRIEEMVNLITGNNVMEHSLNIRNNMIAIGLKWFKYKPILGYGIDTYKVIYNSFYGINFYAHNNYIEILVDLGIIGIICFYSIYVLYIINLLKIKIYKNRYVCMLFSFILVQLFMDIAAVTYEYRLLLIMLTIVDRFIYLYNRERSELYWN